MNRLSINENEDEDGLKESISSALDMINEQISDGILYQNLSRKIGLEFCETMNQHFEFLVSIEKNYLKTYKKFFEIDDATTQIMALGSLKNLCETTHNEIVNFFFEPEDDNFLQCIWTVLCQKNVNVSIAAYKLLSSISR